MPSAKKLFIQTHPVVSSDYLSTTSFLPLIDDEKQYFLLRNKLFHRPTAEESKSNLNYIASNCDPQQATTATTTNSSTKSSVATTAKVKKYEDKLIFHYTHEQRFHSFKRDMRKLYKDHFGDPSAMAIKLIVSNRNRRSATHELVRKRPNKSLLQNKPVRSKLFTNLSVYTNFIQPVSDFLSRLERSKKNKKNKHNHRLSPRRADNITNINSNLI